MQASEVFGLLRVPDKLSAEQTLKKAWLAAQQTPCKDVVAIAIPLKPVPCTIESFRKTLETNNKGHDFVISNWYVIHVGCSDGREWGWSKAPYDSKKRLPASDLKPLYSADSGSTRFWSFKKVSNNMHKGVRVDEEGEDLSFVLPAGTCFPVFLREDNYEPGKSLFAGLSNSPDVADVINAYTPVLLQLSGANCEQAAKGSGLKLRRVIPLPAGMLGSFLPHFFCSKAELEQAQTTAGAIKALSATAKVVGGCPISCRVNREAFTFHDKEASVVEVHDSGVDHELGSRLLIQSQMLLTAVHSTDISRAVLILNVALGHGAVTCLVVKSKESEAAEVVYLHVDLAEAMWLHVLQKSRSVDFPTKLPVSSELTMCFGHSLAQDPASFGTEKKYLQWYCPNQQVAFATRNGSEELMYIVFEMELSVTQVAGQREEQQKLLLMHEVAGPHHTVKIYCTGSVENSQEGFLCQRPRLLLTWQLRPGFSLDLQGRQASTRKRQYLEGDDEDEVNSAGVSSRQHSPMNMLPDMLEG